MPTREIYDLRILLETVEGKKTSYYSSGSNFLPNNFINTGLDGNFMSASMVRDRVRRMVSCSYQNETIFTGEVVNGGGGNSSNYFGKNTNIISASLSGSANTGSIVFTALDNEYDRLLRYKFIGEKVTNVLGLPSDQWVYVDQVRLPADDEANVFQGNANLGNVVITDTLTFAGGSDVNSDVPFLIDTGSDRYVKFVDERAASVVALRMGYDTDEDVYEISGSDDFTFKIGGLNEIQGSVTASTFKFEKNVDGGDATIIIENTNADDGIDKGAGIEFKHRANTGAAVNAGKIIAGKDDTYQLTATPGSGDSNLQFYTTKNNLNYERLRITSDGEARFTGNISASGNIITEGDIIAQNYIVQSTVTQITTSFSSGSTIFGDTPSDDTHQFTGSVSISGSGNDLIVGGNVTVASMSIGGANFEEHLTVAGDISSSGQLTLEKNIVMQSPQQIRLNSVATDDRIFYASAGGINIDSNEGTSVYNNLRVNTLDDSGKALTVAGDISASGAINTLSHITASGNISSSGANSTFGQVVSLVGEDPRLRLKAVGANHPGVEWHEDSTRKWVLYNDPDESDSIVFKNDSTELFKITQAGEVQVTQKISHIGDTDTFIDFTTDDINFQAGGQNMIDLTSGSQSEITFNEAGIDIDFRVEGNGDANLLFTDGGNDKVGIGTNAPPKKLTVAGAISASQNIFIGTGAGTDEKKIIHSGDEDTFLLFDNNKVNLVAGNKSAIKYDASDGKILINNTNADVDFQVMGYGGDEILHVDAAKHSVGIGTTTPPASGSNGHLFVVAGDISASGDLFKTKFVQMTNSSSVIDTFNTGSFRSAKYTLQVTSASNYQVSELLVLHHNSTASNTEYAQINSGLNLIDFTTDISNSNVRLNAAGSFISCSVRLDRTIIPT